MDHEFYSGLPPDALRARMEDWVVEQNTLWSMQSEGTGEKTAIRLTWRGDRFRMTVRRTYRSEGTAGFRGGNGRGIFAGLSAGKSWSMTASHPFSGRIEPRGTGGSVLSGRFRPSMGYRCVLIGMLLLSAGISVRQRDGLYALAALALFAKLLWDGFTIPRRAAQNEDAALLLDALRAVAEEP